MLVSAVPDQPKEIVVKEDSPMMVILTVVPPNDNGGVDIYSYRIEYDQHIQDFKISEYCKM